VNLNLFFSLPLAEAPDEPVERLEAVRRRAVCGCVFVGDGSLVVGDVDSEVGAGMKGIGGPGVVALSGVIAAPRTNLEGVAGVIGSSGVLSPLSPDEGGGISPPSVFDALILSLST
jgi:hypothetical protein